MDCRTAERLISLQPDGQLTNEERAGLIAHVANCCACSWEQQLQERLSMTLRGIGQAEIEAPFELKSLVMNKLRPERRSVLAYIPAAWRKTVAAAAAILLIAGGSAGVTAGFLKVPGVDKMVALDLTPPAVSDDAGDEYAVPGGSAGQTDPGSAGGGPNGDTPGDEPDNKPDTQSKVDEPKEKTSQVATSDTGIQVSRVAGAETGLLSGGMKVTSTVLKFAVDDITDARIKAVSIAAGSGAVNQVFPEHNSGKPVLVMRMTVDSSKAPELISSLGRVGNVVDRQDESRDLTPLYNETMVEYNDLLARRSTVQEPEEQKRLEAQAASYKQQLDSWTEEAGKRIVVVWLESK
jgi:hypothetical protein